ncbi:nuclear pore complex protein Nup98-Nup96-like isoform X3 [Cynoglossus semilaevis]|uniref:nuclear pore complex protein Nup98-Nup96-like isoform X3 n=1 Tax=Cynoglossus semilaevis TaxID=244447 RepID=UPI0007DCB854|nr:nuclear pore complex protein Nup98-Nup96-like isoform X3 [Cynoglossus semilaevis]
MTPGSGGPGTPGTPGTFVFPGDLGRNTGTGGPFGSVQNTPGSGTLFGSSTFGQPAPPPIDPPAFGSSASLFGLGAVKPTTFENMGTATGGARGLGVTNPISFDGTDFLFGGLGFYAAPLTGTAITYTPTTGSDTLVTAGVSVNIQTTQHCITAMEQYQGKSLEELRLEDYLAERKGPANHRRAGTAHVFGSSTIGSAAANTGRFFGQNKNTCGTAPPSGWSGQQNQQRVSSCFTPSGQTTSTQNLSSGATVRLLCLSTVPLSTVPSLTSSVLSQGSLGGRTGSQSGGFFSFTHNMNSNSFGRDGSLSGPPGSGSTGTQQSIFRNKIFGTGTSSTSSLCLSGGTDLLGDKPDVPIGPGIHVCTVGFSPAGGSLFGDRLAAVEPGRTGPGAGVSTSCGAGDAGSALITTRTREGPRDHVDSLGLVAVPGQFGFGHTQNLAPPLGPMGTLDRTGFHSGTDLQSLGSALPFVATSQQSLLQHVSNHVRYSPYQDSPLFRNPLPQPEANQTPTTGRRSPSSRYKLRSQSVARRHRPTWSGSLRPGVKGQRIKDAAESSRTLVPRYQPTPSPPSAVAGPHCVFRLHRRTIRNVRFKYIRRSQTNDADAAAEGEQDTHTHTHSSTHLTQSYTNPIITPIPQHPEQFGLQEALQSPHNTGILLSRVFIDTVPSIQDLSLRVEERVTENLTGTRRESPVTPP